MMNFKQLEKIGHIENFDDAWNALCDALDIPNDGSYADFNVLPWVKTVEEHVKSCYIRLLIGKWVIVYDLSGEEWDYLDECGFCPYYGYDNRYEEYVQQDLKLLGA